MPQNTQPESFRSPVMRTWVVQEDEALARQLAMEDDEFLARKMQVLYTAVSELSVGGSSDADSCP